MSEPESQPIDSQTKSVTEDNNSVKSIEIEDRVPTISEETPVISENLLKNEGEEEVTKPPMVIEKEEDDMPSTPEIIIVTEDGESQQETPKLAINNEPIVTDEPQTPTPASVEESETTLPDDASNSTVTPESLNDDTKPIIIDESDFQGPVIDFYKNKNILMTGVTGFVGKAILWKLIQALRQDIGQIYILIRSGSIKRSKIGRPEERLRSEIFNNKVISAHQRNKGIN